MSIILPSGEAAAAPAIQFTQEQWDEICARLRELDLFRIVIGMIAAKNAMQLTIKDSDLRRMEQSGNVLTHFHDADKECFVFSVHKPDTFIGVAKEQVN